jgi:hypothetical protein
VRFATGVYEYTAQFSLGASDKLVERAPQRLPRGSLLRHPREEVSLVDLKFFFPSCNPPQRSSGPACSPTCHSTTKGLILRRLSSPQLGGLILGEYEVRGEVTVP